MALKLGELVAFLKLNNKDFEAGLVKSKAEMQAAGDDLDRSAAATAFAVARSWITGSNRSRTRLAADIDASKAKLRELAAEYGRTGDKSLLRDMSRERKQIREFEAAVEGLGRGALRELGSNIRTAWTTMAGFASTVGSFASSLWGIVAVVLAIGAAALMAAPLVYVLGGALGSLPALTVGLGAGIGALGLGFMGLSEAFQKTASSGSSVVNRAYQIAQAERRVRDANLEVLASEEALSRARMTAAERMQDLTRSLAGAHLDEESAVQAVADAQRDLTRAQASENPDNIKRADLAYRQALQSLEDVRDRVEDLSKEQADAAKKGVEGSDEVRAALDRQRKATEGVTDATHDLREAQKPPPGGGAAAQLTKLSPAALAAVAAIKSLKPAFESLRLGVQEELFAGVGGEIKSLATAWLPTLHERLGGMAGMFNGLFKNLAKSAKDPEFIRNISAGMGSVQRMFDRIGRSLTGPFMEAFGKLSKAAAPFIYQLGEGIGGIVDDFSRWIGAAEKSGDLDKFFEHAGLFLHDVFDIGKDVASIIGSIVSILFQSPESVTTTPWTAFKTGMDDLAIWFKDPENQKMIADWFKKIEDFTIWLVVDGLPKIQSWIDKIDGWVTAVQGWGKAVVGVKDTIVGTWNTLIGWLAWLPIRISAASAGMFRGVTDAFREALNWMIDKWNDFHLTIGGGTFLGVNIPSVTFETPNITRLARGGVIDPTPGGRLAVLGEAGKREIATPEDLMRRIVREETGGRDRGVEPEVHVYIGDQELRGMVRVEVRESNRSLKRGVLAGAGAR